MGTVYATITIKNFRDADLVEAGFKNEEEIRQTQVKAVVDTGAPTLCITEELRRQLGLEVQDERIATMANGAEEMVKRTEAVKVHWENRSMLCQPVVVPGGKEVLLGAIPLQDMDLIVDPVRHELAGAHGDEIVHLLVGFR